MIMKAKKKPVTIEFVQWTGDNLFEVVTFISRKPSLDSMVEMGKWEDYERIVEQEGLKIPTLEGRMEASIGDYIIKGVQGEFYPCKPDIFFATYDILDEQESETFGKLVSLAQKDVEEGRVEPIDVFSQKLKDRKELALSSGPVDKDFVWTDTVQNEFEKAMKRVHELREETGYIKITSVKDMTDKVYQTDAGWWYDMDVSSKSIEEKEDLLKMNILYKKV